MAGHDRKEPPFLERLAKFNEVLHTGAFTPYFIIYGEQAYLRNQNRDAVREALLDGGDPQMNCTVFTGSDFTAREVIDLAETLPFFAPRRVILFESTGLWGREMTQEADALADYFGTQPETTFFVFSEPGIDRKRRLYTRMAGGKAGGASILACENVEDATLRKWIQARLRREGKTIDGAVLALFRQYAGDDMMNIASETDKLIAFLGDRQAVTSEDIRAICTPVVQDRIFEMIDAIAGGERERSMGIYTDLIRLQTPPQVILSLLQKQYSRLLQIRELQGQTRDTAEIARVAGLPVWMLRRLYPLAGRYRSAAQLERILDACVQADADYKSGRMTDRIALELLITAL